MTVKNYNIHKLFLVAIGVLGNAIMVMPFLNVQNPVFCLLLCCVLTLAIALVALPIIKNARGVAAFGLNTIIILISFYGAMSAFADYVKFLKVMGQNVFLAAILLLVLVVSLTVCADSAYFKFNLLFGVITAALIALLFAVSAREYNLKNISLTPIKLEIKSTLICFVKYFLPVLSAVALCSFSKYKLKTKTAVFGVLLGFFLLALCLIQSVLMLGAAEQYDYTYLSAVGADSLGQLYIRQDGFVWFVFFTASVIKTSLCTKTVWKILLKYTR